MTGPEDSSAREEMRAADSSEDGFRALQPPEPEDAEARAARKRAEIQRATVGVFLQHGYAGTSIDDLAAAARISKQTLYKHFTGKEDLFLAIINGTVGQVLDELFQGIDTRLDGTGDLENDLHRLASRFIRRVMHPELLALRRLVIGEVGRFPQIGDVWWRGGPARVTRELAPQLERLAENNELALEDPVMAADHFNWLVLSIPLNTAMFRPGAQFTTAELDNYAAAGVRAFLAAYGPSARR